MPKQIILVSIMNIQPGSQYRKVMVRGAGGCLGLFHFISLELGHKARVLESKFGITQNLYLFSFSNTWSCNKASPLLS